jgi:predicted metal-dependent hydrolase
MTAEVVQGKGSQAEVIRTGHRKTAAIKVEEGRVCVLVPNSATPTKVEELVTKKTRWIREKLLLQQNFQAPKRKEYVSGECFTYLGPIPVNESPTPQKKNSKNNTIKHQ